MNTPFANGGNGEAEHDGRGRFLRGNQAARGRGNPNAARVNAWRSALAQTVTVEDIRAVLCVLVEKAKAGQPWAVKEFLDRTLGKADQRLELTGEGGGPVATEVTLRLKFADRSLLAAEPVPPGGLPLLESDNGVADAELRSDESRGQEQGRMID